RRASASTAYRSARCTRSGALPTGNRTAQRGRRDVRTKHFVRGGLFGAWIAAAVVIAWAPRGGRGAEPAAARDTVRDSLLVSDSIYQGWKWWHVYCFR